MFDAWQWFITFILGVASWFFTPELDFRWKIILVLSILIFSGGASYIRLYLKTRTLQKEFEEVRERHRAVSSRFDKKRISLAKHQAAIQSLEYAILLAAHSNAKERLNILLRQLETVKNALSESEGDDN